MNDNKLSTKDILYNKYIEKNGYIYPKSSFDLFKFIDEVYVLEWNKTPLTMKYKISYSIYILMMIHKKIDLKNEELYNILLQNLKIQRNNEKAKNI
jgi:hypothetical protein